MPPHPSRGSRPSTSTMRTCSSDASVWSRAGCASRRGLAPRRRRSVGERKSSTVRAGLIPALRNGVLPGSDEWSLILIRPGEHPGRTLHEALVGDSSTPADTGSAWRALRNEVGGDTRDRRRPVRRGLLRVLRRVRANRVRRHAGRCGDRPGCSRERGDHDPSRLLRSLLGASALAELLAANNVLVGPMTADEYRRAIEQPALRVGVHVEPALTEALVAEVGEEPGRPPAPSTALLERAVGASGRSLDHAPGVPPDRRGPRRRLAARGGGLAGSPPSSRGWPGP